MMGKASFLRSALCLIWVVLAMSSMTLTSTEATKASDALMKKMRRTKGKAFKMKNADYKTLTEGPRDFGAVVVVHAKTPNYQCHQCPQAREAINAAASDFTNSRSNVGDTAPPLFFVENLLEDNFDIAQDNRMQAIPAILYFPPVESGNTMATEVKYDLKWASRDMLKFAASRHGITVPLEPDMDGALAASGWIVIIFGLIGSLIATNLRTVVNLPWNKNIVMTVSFITYGLSVGGMVYCLITGSQFAQIRGDYYEFIMPQGRNQFVSEGLLVGSLYVAMAASLLLSYYMAKKQISRETGLGAKMVKVLNHVEATFFLSLFIYFGGLFLSLYMRKTPWYRISELIPGEIKFFTEGSLNVRNPNTLDSVAMWSRRLVKVLNEWIFEYKNWNAFSKKAMKLLKLKWLSPIMTPIIDAIQGAIN